METQQIRASLIACVNVRCTQFGVVHLADIMSSCWRRLQMTHAFTPAARNTITDIQSAACEQPSSKHMFSLTITNAMLNVINPNVPFPAPHPSRKTLPRCQRLPPQWMLM
uniref:Uncharacterized protein n=1 Tax=Xiphophorus maculatus TaxID=8083 RepID=A0A3B5Q5F3_XIPMA